jgi:glycine C-acetyltransferase
VEGKTVAFPSSTGQLFGGYFSPTRSWKFSKNDLIDARGRRLFETTAMACHADAYPFQIPLEARTGPEVRADGHAMLMLSSYDYLGLIGDPRIDAAAIAAVKKYGTGTGGARLLTGTTDQHQLMERDLAAFRGTEAAITFSSGYAANLEWDPREPYPHHYRGRVFDGRGHLSSAGDHRNQEGTRLLSVGG